MMVSQPRRKGTAFTENCNIRQGFFDERDNFHDVNQETRILPSFNGRIRWLLLPRNSK